MKKFLITEEERKSILNQHISKGYKTSINENPAALGASLRSASKSGLKSLSRVAQDSLLSTIKTADNKLFNNFDELIEAFTKGSLSSASNGKILTTFFTKGTLTPEFRNAVGKWIAQSAAFKNKYRTAISGGDDSLRRALRESGKYTDDQIEVLVRGSKESAVDAAQNTLSSASRGKGQYGKFSQQLKDRFKELANAQHGKEFRSLFPKQREEIIQQAVKELKTQSPNEIITWREILTSLEGMVTAGSMATLLTIGLWDFLKDEGVEGLPPRPETETATETASNLGDRVLVRGSKGDDVKQLQQKLVDNNFDLGSYGPNSDGVDGVYGGKTEEAVRRLQMLTNIKVDGKYGPESHRTLMNYKPEDYSPLPDEVDSVDNVA